MEPLQHAARVIREGGLVAFPTETVYGLGANALDPAAVRRIFERKGRPSTSPLIVHAHSVAMARELVSNWPEQAESLAAAHWPGPLTLVLPKRKVIPDLVTAGLPTVGIRVPRHPVALALIREAGLPIAAPSANQFTHLSPTTAAHVREAFGPDLIVLEGGPSEVGIESTVVSLAGPKPVLLRPGAIRVDAEPAPQPGSGESHPSPGMHARHYSPTTPLYLVSDAPNLDGRGFFLSRSRMPATPERYAAVLYSKLHELDAQGWDWIAVESPPGSDEWTAVRDRLFRAAVRTE